MMTGRRLPPLNALRAFEAAARRESFAGAARELFVTPSAVSQQIRLLEDWLGLELFRRRPRGLAVTEHGRRYLPAVSAALDQLADATRRLVAEDRARALTISTTTSFATLWLVPRLWSFRQQYPELDVRVSSSDRLVDLHTEDVDLAIRFGTGDYADVSVERLVEEQVAPVCAPALVDGDPPLRTPNDLRFHTLIHQDSGSPYQRRMVGWPEWLAAAGAHGVDPTHGPQYDSIFLTFQEAVAGRGIALGHRSLVEEELAAGRLVAPFDLWLPSGGDYYVLCTPQALEREPVRRFRDWLLEAACATRWRGP